MVKAGQMSRPAPKIRLSLKEREILLRWMRGSKTEQRMVERARVILLASNGLSGKEIALKMQTREARVSKWLRRFAQDRIGGLNDSARSAEKRRKYTALSEERILKALDEPAPPGYSRWNGRLLAEHLGNVSKDQVWRVMRKHNLHLERRQSWCVSTDPEFSRKAADVVGLYMSPPQDALVLCVDEKPCIQALERAQGWIRLPNGRALTGFAHEYKRHGTTTLFAALEVATGLVHSGHYRRRRRREFLDFMNDLVSKYPGQELHVVLDNLNTHKPKEDRWLKTHPHVHFHFIPTHSSWLNQVECWFSILSRQRLTGQQFHQCANAGPGDRSLYRELEPECSPFRVDQTRSPPARFEAFLR
jgi:transposase